MDPQGLMFTRYHWEYDESTGNIAKKLFSDLKTPFFKGPQVQSVDELVIYHQINFCGDDYSYRRSLYPYDLEE